MAVTTAAKNEIGLGIVTLLIMVLITNARILGGNHMVFPGMQSTYPSPNGKYVLVNVDDDKTDPPHKLLLRDAKTHIETALLSYGRGVEALWSPDGGALIINDHAGSDNGDAYVFTFTGSVGVDLLINRVSILKQLKKDFQGDATLFQNDHVYVEGTDWIAKNKIKVKVHGHGEVNPDGFTVFFEYTLGDHIRKLAPAS